MLFKRRFFGKTARGSGLTEYSILIGFVVVAIGGGVMQFGESLNKNGLLSLGDSVEMSIDESAWEVERPLLENMGYVSPYKEQKILGVAKDYKGKVTFLYEGAGFRNALGMFKVNKEGQIYDIQILFSNASLEGSGGDLISGESFVEVELFKGDQVGFFVSSNGYGRNNPDVLETGTYVLRDSSNNVATVSSTDALMMYHINSETGEETPVRSQYAHNLFYSHANPDSDFAPNADNYPHTVSYVHGETGAVTIGFEDLWAGGDKDYDDVVLQFDIGRSNAVVLEPNLTYDYEGYDDWVQRLGLTQYDDFVRLPQ